MALAALVARLLAALPFGYGLAALTVSALAGLLTLAGMARADAVVLMAMLGFVLYLLWLLWAFATRSLLRVYGALVLGLASAGLVQQLLQPSGA
jgi:hypothetical protein